MNHPSKGAKSPLQPDDSLSTPEAEADQVADFLRSNPTFFADNPDLMADMQVPARWDGDGVVDMQQFMLDRLREDIENLSICAQDVIETSRANMTNQTRTHAAILAVLGADAFPDLVRVMAEELPLLLDVDAVSVGFETPALPNPGLVGANVRRFPTGYVDQVMAGEHDVLLLREASDDGTVFGADAQGIRSAAIARLRPGNAAPAGVLAFGMRQVGAFHPGQGTELIVFLARVVERLVHKWLTTET